MKKLALVLAIVLGMTFVASAQEGGLFGKGPSRGGTEYSIREGESLINLPSSHGSNDDAGAPLGSGIALLISLGAAYGISKRRKE